MATNKLVLTFLVATTTAFEAPYLRSLSPTTAFTRSSAPCMQKTPNDDFNEALDKYKSASEGEMSRRTVIGSFVGALSGIGLTRLFPQPSDAVT